MSQHLEFAMSVTPGASQTKSKAPGQIGPASGEFPLFALSAMSPYSLFCESAAGTMAEYVDLFGANAAIPLGYRHPRVSEAVASEVPLYSLPSDTEAHISAQFLSVCAPWASSVRWVKTGSEAMSAAVRLARIATGRSTVVVFSDSYHGWHDWTFARFQDVHPRWHEECHAVFANGVPSDMGLDLAVLPYGQQIASVKDCAAVIFEAQRFDRTDHAWIEETMRAARADGALVIFDEMVYGLRWHKQGARGFYDTPLPDLACFGKALGNGYAVACVCGRGELMAPAANYISGTYGGDQIGMLAASAVLAVYDKTDVISLLKLNGSAVWSGFAAETDEALVRLKGFPVHWKLETVDPQADIGLIQERAASGQYGPRLLVSRYSNNASAVMPEHVALEAGRTLGRAAMSVVGKP